jgi:hypothetical protein
MEEIFWKLSKGAQESCKNGISLKGKSRFEF